MAVELAKELWSYDAGRARQWGAVMSNPGEPVILRHYAALAPGEQLDEYPPTLQLPWDEWTTSHADYGLNVDGTPA